MKLMLDYKKINKEDIYSYTYKNKNKFFIKYFKFLDNHHRKNCLNYRKFTNALIPKLKKGSELENFPMLPVNIFKKFDLISVPKKKITKKMTSSGTSGSNPSKIFLDGKNSLNQKIALSLIIENFLGKNRLSMLIVDKKSTVQNSSNFTARSAAILGFSLFGKDYTYLLKENNEINYETLNNFLKKNKDKQFFIFGFTSYVFENLIQKISKSKIISDFGNGILLHGGGWKKLEEKKISNNLFKNKLSKKLNLKKIHNYYGMIEQTGSIFIECKYGYFHTTIFSEIFIRDINFKIITNKKKGLVQLVSLLPSSYPGHNIITEDIGRIIGVDDCKCGHKGKYFEILGRAPETELRGCSDVK